MSATSTENRRERREERERVTEILAIADKHGHRDKANEFIKSGGSFEDFRVYVLENQGRFIPVKDSPPIGASNANLGLSRGDIEKYSLFNLLDAMANRTTGQKAGFEQEISFALAEKYNTPARGMYVPLEVLTRGLTRGITAGPGGTGQYLVETDHMASEFVELLRNRSAIVEAGARTISGLVGDISIPKQGTGVSVGWVGEGQDAGESDPVFEAVTMTPKTMGVYSDYTRKTMLQATPDIERLLREDMIQAIATEVDRVALHGSGVDFEPLGIVGADGVTINSLGAPDGGAPSWASLVDLIGAVSSANADTSRTAFIMNSATKAFFHKLPKIATYDSTMTLEGDSFLGRRIFESNNVAADLTKGAGDPLSAIFYGDFSSMLIGQWGGLDINIDRSSLSRSGGVRVVTMMDIDLAVRTGQSFAVNVDADLS